VFIMNIFTVQFNINISWKFLFGFIKQLHIMYFNFGQCSISNLIVQNSKVYIWGNLNSMIIF